MLNFLYKYLVLKHHVSIPGVGSFAIDRSPATIKGNIVEPPAYSISFIPGTALTDKEFYRFLSLETGLSEVDAVRRFQDFAYQLRKDIQSNPQVELSGLGTLKRNAQGDIEFGSSPSVDRYFSSITVSETAPSPGIAADEAVESSHGIDVYPEDEIVQKDRWWIWALVLMVIALAIIGYFYMLGDII